MLRTNSNLFRLFIVLILSVTLINLTSAEMKKGDNAPVFNLRNFQNQLTLVFRDINQKPLLLSFFYAGCAPCRKEIPELEKLHKQYGNKIQMYLVGTSFNKNVDVVEDVKSFIEPMKISIEVLIDKYQSVISDYGIKQYPTTILIGKGRKIKFISKGFNDEKLKELVGTLKSEIK